MGGYAARKCVAGTEIRCIDPGGVQCNPITPWYQGTSDITLQMQRNPRWPAANGGGQGLPIFRSHIIAVKGFEVKEKESLGQAVRLRISCLMGW